MKKSSLFAHARAAVVILFLFSTSLHGAEAAYPPEPEMPKTTREMSREQRRALNQKWKAEHEAWEKSLTAEQLLAWKNAKEETRMQALEKQRRRVNLPAPGSDYDWRVMAADKNFPATTVARLEQQKAAYGPSAKQSFAPYLDGPVFVTSDSLLNGFHVLFEDTFREIELRRAHTLMKDLETLVQAAGKFREGDGKFFPEARYRAALRHAHLVLGPAIVVLGGSVEQFEEVLRPEINSQAEKILRSDAVELPGWLAPANDASLSALDYRRCKPVGFYSDNEKLAAYFRAVRWLQMVPFRGARVVEFDAIVLLGLAGKDAKVEQVLQRGTRFVGPPDDPSASDLAAIVDNAYPRSSFEPFDCLSTETKNKITRRLIEDGYYQINSNLRRKQTGGDTFADFSFRVMPASRLQDTVLFQQLMNKRIAPRGLTVAAMLGSPFAAKQLTADERAQVGVMIKSLQDEADDGGGYLGQINVQVYRKYLHVLEALFEPPPADAPAFMKGEFWAAKNCQTALGGWAQMRHTFTLQAKLSVYYLGLLMVPPGFVEPNPEFFARMARLLDETATNLEADGLFELPGTQAQQDLSKLRQRWDALRFMAHRLEAMVHKQLRREAWTDNEAQYLRNYGERLAYAMGYFGNSRISPRDDAPRWAEVARDPRPGRDSALAVAVGRPRYLYVLYPWNGMEILCQGSVMQYYEYDAKGAPLTDGEWLKLLDSPEAPQIPEWLREFADAPGKPVARR